jgi:hypothetical protein
VRLHPELCNPRATRRELEKARNFIDLRVQTLDLPVSADTLRTAGRSDHWPNPLARVGAEAQVRLQPDKPLAR